MLQDANIAGRAAELRFMGWVDHYRQNLDPIVADSSAAWFCMEAVYTQGNVIVYMRSCLLK